MMAAIELVEEGRGYEIQRGGAPGTFSGTVTDGYYSREEYAFFLPENKQQLFEICAARDSARGVSAVGTAQVAATSTTATTRQLTPVNPGTTSQCGAAVAQE